MTSTVTEMNEGGERKGGGEGEGSSLSLTAVDGPRTGRWASNGVALSSLW